MNDHKTFLNSLINKSTNVKTINKVNIDSKNHKVSFLQKTKYKTKHKKKKLIQYKYLGYK